MLLRRPTRTNKSLFTIRASASSTMQETLKKSIVDLISQDANQRVMWCGDGCVLSYSSQLPLLRTPLAGEPDGGLTFSCQVLIPFVNIEVGVSDTMRKTNGQTWLSNTSDGLGLVSRQEHIFITPPPVPIALAPGAQTTAAFYVSR